MRERLEGIYGLPMAAFWSLLSAIVLMMVGLPIIVAVWIASYDPWMVVAALCLATLAKIASVVRVEQAVRRPGGR